MSTVYDLIIIGAGPAGLSASIYASRFGIKHLILAKEQGGTIVWASEVANYPGIPDITGFELAQEFIAHAKKLGAEISQQEVMRINKNDQGVFEITTTAAKTYQSKTVIMATGTRRRSLGVPGEKEFLGKGVSYCCTCDAAFFKNKIVAIVGGANAACSGAVHLSKFAQKVYLLYRQDKLRAEPFWVKEVESLPNIEILYETTVIEIKGNKSLESVVLSKPYKGKNTLFVSGLFIEVGGVPISEMAKELGIKLDKSGYIVTDNNMVTSVPGFFCAGDLNSKSRGLQQIVTATSQGAWAALASYKFLKKA